MKNVKTACLIAALTGLYGCGGGGGGGGSTSMNLETAQGIWDSSSYSGTDLGASTKAIRSVMLKDGNAWVFLLDNLITNNPTPIGLVKASVAVSGQSFSGTGKRYMLADASTHAVAVTGSVPAASTVSLNFSDSAGGSSTATTTAAVVSRFNAVAAKADMAAVWTFSATQPTVGGGSVSVTWNWNVDANGTLSGTNSLGCNFTGTVLPRSESVAVFDTSITENCAGTTRIFNGVAFQNSAHSSTTFGLILNDGSTGTVAVAQKVEPT